MIVLMLLSVFDGDNRRKLLMMIVMLLTRGRSTITPNTAPAATAAGRARSWPHHLVLVGRGRVMMLTRTTTATGHATTLLVVMHHLIANIR